MVLMRVHQPGATITMDDAISDTDSETASPIISRTVSYGSCDSDQPKQYQGTSTSMNSNGMLQDIQEDGSFYMSSSDEDDEDNDELSYLHLDLEAPPPPPPPPTSAPALGRVHYHDSISRSSLPSVYHRGRAVSFQVQTTSKMPASRSPDFRQAWRRKSSRRVSAIMLGNNPFPKKRKTAKEHWAILREHVLSGRFFLDQDFMMEDYNNNGSLMGASKKNQNAAGSTASRRRSLLSAIQGGLEWTTGQCLCAIAAYLITAVLWFNFVIPETRNQWTIIDSMYFAVSTFTTIGFGDITPPDTALARLSTCVFALTGVASLGVVLGVIGNRVVELESKAMRYCEQDVLSLFASAKEGDSLKTTAAANDATMPREQQSSKPALWTRVCNRLGGRRISNGYHALEAFLRPAAPSSSVACSGGGLPCQTNACRRRKTMYERKLGNKSSNFYHFLQHINRRFTVFLVLLLLLSFLIGYHEGWDWIQTLYFGITTSCTIGYGDKVPTSQVGRLCVVAFIPFAVGAMGCFLQQMAELIVLRKQRRHMGSLFGTANAPCREQQRELTVRDLEAMDADGDGNVDWSEFLEFMLIAMKKIDEDLLWELRYQFDSLDVDDTGILSKQNLIAMARRKLKDSSHKLQMRQYKRQLLKKSTGDLEEPKDFASIVSELLAKKRDQAMGDSGRVSLASMVGSLSSKR